MSDETMYDGYGDEEELVDGIEEEDEDELDFEKLFGDLDTEGVGEEEEDDEEEEEETEAESTPQFDSETGEWFIPTSGEKLLPQSKVNEIMGSSRIKGRQYEDNVKYLEMEAGMPFNQIIDSFRNQRIQQAIEEHNMEPEQAVRYVDDGKARRLLEEEMLQIRYQQQMQQAQFNRNAEKQQYISNPLVKQYENEIDALVDASAQSGKYVSWQVAMDVILGQKAREGGLAETIKRTTKKQMSNVRKPMMAPETGGGAPSSEAVPREIAFFAKALGEDPRESFSEYKRIKKGK